MHACNIKDSQCSMILISSTSHKCHSGPQFLKRTCFEKSNQIRARLLTDLVTGLKPTSMNIELGSKL